MDENVEMMPNSGQKASLDSIIQFLLTDQKEYNLKGAAGTGKTFMMRYITERLLKDYQNLCKVMGFGTPKYWQVVYAATTNKAADVLSRSVHTEARTIHSFLGLVVKNNYKTGKQELTKTSNFRIHSNILLFIDEASMIDAELYDIISEAFDDTCKIIYVSDSSQLTPVSESLSKIYKDEIPHSTLTEPMRNHTQPALMELCQQFRKTVETGKFYPIKIVEGVIDWLDGPLMKFAIDHVFKEENADSRILCYTNKKVNEYNNYIRAMRNYGDQYVVGENLIFNSAFNMASQIIPAETPVRIVEVDPTITSLVTPIGKLDSYKIAVAGVYDFSLAWLKIPVDPAKLTEVLKHYSKVDKDWASYYSVKETYPDLRPRDASTVHKAQGSTYDSVFIDLDNIGTHFNPDETARMLYVAVSRARTRIFLRGSLPRRYGGHPYNA